MERDDWECNSVHDASLPVTALATYVRTCGFAHIGPGLFPDEYVAEVAAHVKRQPWRENSSDVYVSGAYGGRINVVPARNGPFAKDKPFLKPNRTLFELMQHVLSPGQCCHLFLFSVMIALRSSAASDYGDQAWHRDQLRFFQEKDPWVLGRWNHYYLYLYPHDVTESLGPIELMPASQPFARNDLTARDAKARSSSGRSIGRRAAAAYTASGRTYHAPFLAAGSVLIHEASLAHRGLRNQHPDVDRYAVRFDLFALGDQRVGALAPDPSTYHGRPKTAKRTHDYTGAFFRALRGLELAPPPKERERQQKALARPIVPFNALTSGAIYSQYSHATLWVGGTRAALKARRKSLESSAAALGGHVVFLDEAEADARELYAQFGLWVGVGGLQLAGTTYDAATGLVRHPGRFCPRRQPGAACGASVRSLVDAMLQGKAPRLVRSAPPVWNARPQEAVAVVRSSFEALVQRASVPILLLLYSSDLCCSGTTWACAPCERLSPAIEQLAATFHTRAEGGARGTMMIATYDVHTNDLPPGIEAATRLPSLHLVTPGGPVIIEAVDHSLYADEATAVDRLTEFLISHSQGHSLGWCPAGSS